MDYIIRGLTGVTPIAARVSYQSDPAFLSVTLGEVELEKRLRELDSGQVIGPF